MKRTMVAATAVLALVGSGFGAQAQQSVESFYKGKNIELLIGYSAGGGYDTFARLVARYMTKHIPGNPNIVPRNMPGGGGRVVSGFVARVAPKDGTVLATADQSLTLQQALGDKTIQFDNNAFNWIGNPADDNNTLVTNASTGVKTVEDATKTEVALGATGANTTSEQYPKVMNAMLGTKFKIVNGYPGGNDATLAMERQEVGGRGSNSWATWKFTRPDWIKDGKMNILVQIGLKKAADLPDVPLLLDLAKNEQDRAALRLLSAPVAIGRPLFTTPGVPAERVKALRDAFDATMKDPEFLEAAQKERLEINPVSGVELQKIVSEIVSAPKETVERLVSIVGSGA
ncbi:MAG: tripartite tricarboxylate transporter family receptor [Hyphomicrobiales bacterium]|nr:tripartite tricarboxylate transporter family receptor [Hyphomicrobiales bacterium]